MARQIQSKTDKRLTLPSGWQGQRYFSYKEWARILQILKENPEIDLEQLLLDKDRYLPEL